MVGRFGNAGTAALLTVHPKLEVGSASDPLEREADSIADKVVRMKAGGDCAACGRGEPCDGGAKVRRAGGTGGGGAIALAPAAEASVRRATSGGEPLPAPVRAAMEPRFGADFSGVRVHRDSAAADSARGIGARAYTLGDHIAFGAGQWAPGTNHGDRLIAHELTHSLQDGAATRRVLRDQDDEAGPDSPALGQRLRAERDIAAAEAGQDQDRMLRAYGTRRLILLSRAHPPFTEENRLEAFLTEAAQLATTEIETLNALGPAWAQIILDGSPRGFPLTWSGRIHSALSLGADVNQLAQEYQAELARLTQMAAALPDPVVDSGLPLGADEALRPERFRLRVTDRTRSGPVGGFASATARFAYIRFGSSAAFVWEALANQVAESVADGSYVPSPADYADFVRNRQSILRNLPTYARERLAASDEDMGAFEAEISGLRDVALGAGVLAGFAGFTGIFAAWAEGAALFDGALRQADGRIAGLSGGERIMKALRWAQVNGYYSAAAIGAVDQLIANGPEILAELGLILIAQAIPGVNIAVDIILIVRGVADLVSFIDQTAAAYSAAERATDVGSLQRASVNLARVAAGAGITLSMAIVTAGAARLAGRVRSRAAQLRAAERGLSEEAALRRAAHELGDADTPVIRQAAAARDWEAGLNAETVAFLRTEAGGRVRQLYLEMAPRIREMLTHCASLCVVTNITRSEISRVVRVVERVGEDSIGRLKIYFHVRRNNISEAIDHLSRVQTREALDRLLTRALIREATPPTRALGPGEAAARRESFGIVSGGERLPWIAAGEPWLEQAGGRMGLIPGQIAYRLRNRPFNRFSELQEAFWLEVANNPALMARFTGSNPGHMARGNAPFSSPATRPPGTDAPSRGGRVRYELHHITPIEHGGAVYDLDNLLVVDPHLHGSVIHAPTEPMPALPPRPGMRTVR